MMSDIVALLQAGLAHRSAGRLAEAEAAYRAVLATTADEPRALHYLGLLMLATGRATEALDMLVRAARSLPDHDLIRIAIGRAMLAAGRVAEAGSHFRAMTAARPLCALPRASLALALLGAHDARGARREAQAALLLDPACADAWFALGTALSRMGRPAEAIAPLERAVAAAPGHAEGHLNLGNALFDLDHRDAAEAAMRHAVALDPSLAEAHASLGCLLSGDGRLTEAIVACDRAIALRADFAQAHWNQSFALLLAGDYAAGWEKYEWRKRNDPVFRHLQVLPGREWLGEAIAGLTLLVRAEQGLGDTIQFARFLPLLAERGANVVLACAGALMPLLNQMAGVQVVSSAAALPEYDLWVDQMSLPRLLGIRLDTIPDAGGFLVADPERTARWRLGRPDMPHIGLVWAGNPLHSNDSRRSMPVEAMRPLVAIDGCRFISLQVGPTAARGAAALGLDDHTDAMTDLAETAALMASLDLVIAVDSCVAHLAGALGRPAWVMLPFAPDWRWMIGRTDSPWYASVSLFRQTGPGDWRGPVAAIAGALDAWIRRPAWSPPPPVACAPAFRSHQAASR